jgi:lipoate-protein ligase B
VSALLQPVRPGLLVRTTRIGYAPSWDLQRRLAAARAGGRIPDVVWLLEHDPVYTVGRHGTREDLFASDAQLAAMGAEFHAIDRGGQMTWHGPGQTTGYAILDLRPGARVRGFVDALVGAMADAADAAGVAGTEPGDATGLYREGRKLGSVGIRVREGVTTHGLALNRSPSMHWYALMTACGAPDVAATSVAAEGGDPDRERLEAALADALGERLGLRLEPAPLEAIVDAAGG